MSVELTVDKKLSRHFRKKKSTAEYKKWRTKSVESKTYIAILFAMCRGKCPVCNKSMVLCFDEDIRLSKKLHNISATLDHTIPLSVTMEHDKTNLAIMCSKCNRVKGSNEPKTNNL